MHGEKNRLSPADADEKPVITDKEGRHQRRKKKHKLHSLRMTVMLYFMIFIISIIVITWIAFVLSFQWNYRASKTRAILAAADYIEQQINSSEFTTESLDTIAHDNTMCIIVQDRYCRTVYSYDMMGYNCLIHGVQAIVNLPMLRESVLNTDNGVYYTSVDNPRFNTKMLILAMTVGSVKDPDGYIFINTSLEPLSSMVDLVNEQMIQASVAIFITGIGIAYFLSKLISTPIVKITRSAEKMGQGDYNVKFDGKGYTEAETLADTLNYASSEISKVDNLRRDLMSNISHDLRTPLTMVKAYAEMIRDLSGDNPAKRAEHIQIIIDESDRLAALVNDILDLSRLENGTAELNKTEFVLKDKLSEVMLRYKLLSEQQGYRFYLSADVPVTVKADVIKIEQVLYNLINNAVNYCGESREIYIMQMICKNKVRICITDTGPGIEKELMPLIFDRYYRAEKTRRDVIGTGLGLSIVKQILIAHGFGFGVQSELGVGSTFWFEMDIVSDEFADNEIEVVE